jgi:lysine-N-methylase
MENTGEGFYSIKQPAYLAKFKCSLDECEDTCCKGWGMQVDLEHKKLFENKAPELLDSITPDGEADLVMKRDPKTDYCVKFEDGLCGIHKSFGDKFLSDACHFYPRVTRELGDKLFMSAAISCPEIAKLCLFENNAFDIVDEEIARIPASLKHYAQNTDGKKDIDLVKYFLDIAGDSSNSPERNLSIILTIAKSLSPQPKEKWPDAFSLYKKMADGLLMPPKRHFADIYRLINILVALVAASKKSDRLRLEETIATMEDAMQMRIDRKTLQIVNYAGEDVQAFSRIERKWEQGASEKMAPILRRWLQGQISMNCFPYSGFGNNLEERRIILAVRFSTVRLALMCHMDENGNPPDEETIIRIVQSLARFYDHLADPKLSILAYSEAGWNQDARLRSLIGDKENGKKEDKGSAAEA